MIYFFESLEYSYLLVTDPCLITLLNETGDIYNINRTNSAHDIFKNILTMNDGNSSNGSNHYSPSKNKNFKSGNLSKSWNYGYRFKWFQDTHFNNIANSYTGNSTTKLGLSFYKDWLSSNNDNSIFNENFILNDYFNDGKYIDNSKDLDKLEFGKSKTTGVKEKSNYFNSAKSSFINHDEFIEERKSDSNDSEININVNYDNIKLNNNKFKK